MKVLEGQQGKRSDEAEYLTYTHKRCTRCDAVKIVDQFYRKTTKTIRGWAWDTYCIECRRQLCRIYGASNKPMRNQRLRQWRKDNPEAAAAIDRRRRLKVAYGLTPEQVDAMEESQGGRCAICGEVPSRLFLDHCHTTGHVRALLCPPCNTFLGWYEKKADIILRFQSYIENHTDADLLLEIANA